MKIESNGGARQLARVGGWTIDLRRCGISSGDKFVKLEPRPMAVLQCLARAEGEVVSVPDLKQDVWGETNVVDDVVKRCISQIRAAFGDNAQLQYVVATIPKQGYRLACDVEWTDPQERAQQYFDIKDRLSFFKSSPRVSAIFAIASLLLIAASSYHWTNNRKEIAETREHDGRHDLQVKLATARQFYQSYEFPDNESAIELYRQIVVDNPSEAEAYAGLSNALLQRFIRWDGPSTMLAEARTAAETAIRLDNSLSSAYKALGLYHQSRSQFTDAIEAYSIALELEPDNWAAANNLGEVFREEGKLEAAQHWFECALEISNDQEESLNALGELHFRAGQYDVSEKYFQRVLVLAPYSQDALIGFSFLSLVNNDPKAAIAYCERLLSVWPDADDCVMNSGIAAIMMEDYQIAEQKFRLLIESGSPYWEIRAKVRHLQTNNHVSREKQNTDPGLIALLEDAHSKSMMDRHEAYWYKSLVAAIQMNTELALEYFSVAVEHGHSEFRWDMLEPGFAMLRREPQFIAIVSSGQSNDVTDGSNDYIKCDKSKISKITSTAMKK